VVVRPSAARLPSPRVRPEKVASLSSVCVSVLIVLNVTRTRALLTLTRGGCSCQVLWATGDEATSPMGSEGGVLMTQHEAGILIPRGALPDGQAVTVRFDFLETHPHRLKALTPVLYVIAPGPQPADCITARLPLWLSAAPPRQDLEVLFSPQDDHSRWEALPLDSFVVVPGRNPSCHVALPGWGRLVITAAAAGGSESGGSGGSSERSDSPEPSPPESPGSGEDVSGGSDGGESGSPSSVRTRSYDEAMQGRERVVHLQAYGPPVWEFKTEGERPSDLLHILAAFDKETIRTEAEELMSNRNPLKPLQFYGKAQASWVPGATLRLTLPTFPDAQFEILPGRSVEHTLFPIAHEQWLHSIPFALRPVRLATSGTVELLLQIRYPSYPDRGTQDWSMPNDQKVMIMPAYRMGGAFVKQGGAIGSGFFAETFRVKSEYNDGLFAMKTFKELKNGLRTIERELTLYYVRRE
jgi:hypothetical protein